MSLKEWEAAKRNPQVHREVDHNGDLTLAIQDFVQYVGQDGQTRRTSMKSLGLEIERLVS